MIVTVIVIFSVAIFFAWSAYAIKEFLKARPRCAMCQVVLTSKNIHQRNNDEPVCIACFERYNSIDRAEFYYGVDR